MAKPSRPPARERNLEKVWHTRRFSYLPASGRQLLNFFFMTFCDEEKPVAYPAVSYGFYPVYANLYRLPRTEVPLREDFRLEPDDYCGIGKNIVIANPNAPT